MGFGAKAPWELKKTAGNVTKADVAAVTARFPVTAPDIGPGAVTTTAIANSAVTTVALANDAVTQPKAATGVVDGDTITGAVIQTAASGERIVIRNDGSGGIIESFSGISGEILPSAIDPTLGGKTNAYLEIRSGTSTGKTEQSTIGLNSGSASASSIGLLSSNIGIGQGSGPVSSITLVGIGAGAGIDSWQVSMSGGVASPTDTTNITLTGISQAVTSLGATAVYLVTLDADVEVTGGTQNVIELLVDGVAQTASMQNTLLGVASSVSVRRSASKKWRITGLSSGSHTFTARTRNTAASTFTNVYDIHTQMTVERKA